MRGGGAVWDRCLEKSQLSELGLLHVKASLCFGSGGFVSAEAPIALLTVGSYQQYSTRVWLWLVGEMCVL